MILFLDNSTLPNVSPDLSDLLQLYIRRNSSVYRNTFVDKYELSKKWKVPFIEIKKSFNNELVAITGYYNFESVNRGKEIIKIDDWRYSIFNFLDCPRCESTISFNIGNQYFELVKIAVKFDVVEVNYNNNTKDSFANGLFSYTIEFKIDNHLVKICSDDFIRKVPIRMLEDYKVKYNRSEYNIYFSYCENLWIDYTEAKTFLEIKNILHPISSLLSEGLKVDQIDFSAFGYIYEGNLIKTRLKGFLDVSDFLYAVICSKVYEENENYIIELPKMLLERMIPYYEYILENTLNSKIKNNIITVNREQFKEIDTIIPYLVLNIMRNRNRYFRNIYTKRTGSNKEYAELIAFEQPVSSYKFESLIKDILKLKASHNYSVLYRTGDRDDVWFEEEVMDLSFSMDIDKVISYAIMHSNSGLTQNGNTFHYSHKISGTADRYTVGYANNYSEEYKKGWIIKMCDIVFDVYSLGFLN